MRIVVIGTSCAGKTTLASKLSKQLDIPHIELDELHWLPEWQPRERNDFRERVTQAVTPNSWVMDGNYSDVRDIAWSRATHILWLNYSFPLVVWRSLQRTTRRVFLRERLFSNNVETFRKAFLSKHSILWWVLKTHYPRKQRYQSLFQALPYPHLKILEFQTPKETERWCQSLSYNPSNIPSAA